MSEIDDLRSEVAALRAEVQRLSIGTTRLGPRPETQAETDARTQRITEMIERIKDENNPARMAAVVAAQVEVQPGSEPQVDWNVAAREAREALDNESADSTSVVPPPALCTTDGRPVAEARASQTNETGQHPSYIVLCPDERAKGFVRPYRDAYKHVGLNICGLHIEGDTGGTVCYMDPKHEGTCGDATGPRPQGCGSVTTMGRALSETYARNPAFYGATFCCSCNRHLPVSEFIWTADGERVGS